ncbi:CapA family protein [Haloferacaceae archaeon DSL9]
MTAGYRLGFTGDVMVGRLVDEAQAQRDVRTIWGDCFELLCELDGLCINLECCLSTRGTPWRQTYHPYHFRADPARAIPALRTVGVDYCSLANNHLLDFGPDALFDTLTALDAAGIAHAGAGATVEAARAPAFFDVGTLTVGAVSFTDNTPEFAATVGGSGVAHVRFDERDARTRRIVGDALESVHAGEPDLVVASLHWGPNMRTAPPERFREFARWLAARGVDIVHGHSAHVFQGVEVVDGTLVCYDAGDFVDDYVVDTGLRNDRSFLFEVAVSSDGTLRSLRLHPTEIREKTVTRAGAEAAAWSRGRMRELSEPMETTFETDDGSLLLELA